MGIDISKYIQTNGVIDTTLLTSALKQTVEPGTTDFDAILNDESSKLDEIRNQANMIGEMKSLIDALDQSILGNVLESLDTEELAEDLLADPSQSKDVLNGLMGGHMQSIVMTSSDEKKDMEDSLASSSASVLNGKDVATESLAENLETIMASIKV